MGEKITVGNVCLFCNGKGRGMRSIEAVRKHMVKGVLYLLLRRIQTFFIELGLANKLHPI